MPDRLKSRKLWICIGMAALFTALLWLGKITAAEWKDVMAWVVPVYLAAQGFADGMKK